MKVGLSRALALLSLLLAAGAAAEGPGRAQIPDTPLGRRVAGFVSAFNSGDEKAMIGFWTADFTPESLRQRPVEARLQFYRRMREEMKTIAVAAVEESTPTAIALKMKTKPAATSSSASRRRPILRTASTSVRSTRSSRRRPSLSSPPPASSR